MHGRSNRHVDQARPLDLDLTNRLDPGIKTSHHHSIATTATIIIVTDTDTTIMPPLTPTTYVNTINSQ